MNRFVLSGGPGVGKTTVINILKNRGYVVVPETARLVIEKEQDRGSDILPWKDLFKFQETVALEQMVREDDIRGDNIFFDRSLVDGHAYCLLGGVSSPKIISEKARSRYRQVFILDPLNTYETDSARHENEFTAKVVHQAIIEAYFYFGYSPIMVPVLDPEVRADYIIDNINHV